MKKFLGFIVSLLFFFAFTPSVFADCIPADSTHIFLPSGNSCGSEYNRGGYRICGCDSFSYAANSVSGEWCFDQQGKDWTQTWNECLNQGYGSLSDQTPDPNNWQRYKCGVDKNTCDFNELRIRNDTCTAPTEFSRFGCEGSRRVKYNKYSCNNEEIRLGYEDCPSGQVCSGNGQCVTSCNNNCTSGATQLSCSGNSVLTKTCVQQSNGCYDWNSGSTSSCPSGQVCSENGQCVQTPTATATPTPTGIVKKPCWICDAGSWRKAGGALNLTSTESECLNTEKGVWQDTQPTASCLTNCPDNKICYKCNAGQFTQNGQQSDCNSGSPACSSAITTGVCCSAGLPSGTCGGYTPTPSGTVTPTITESPTPTPVVYTAHYRCSDIKFNKNDSGSSAPAWKEYKNEDLSGEPIKFKYTFTSNVVPGNDLTLFCQFKSDSDTTSQVYQQSIKYIGGDPKITSASCSYDPSGIGTQVIIKGINFGNHDEQGEGKVVLASKDTTISYWAKDVEASGSAEATGSSQLNYKVVAKIKDKLPDGKYPIALTNDDGRTADGYCSIGTTTIDFTLKTTCGAIFQDLSQDNVSADVTEKVDKAKPLVKKKIKIDKEGKSEDFAPSVEIGKDYVLTLKGPKSVSRKTEFTAEEGTTNLGDIILSVGDIYPVSVPDNKINAFDKSEMGREWSLVTDVERPADLNNDKRVNSVDYSCFLNNYNRSGD